MTALPTSRPALPLDSALSPVFGDGRNEQQLFATIMMEGLTDDSNAAFKKIAHFREKYFMDKRHKILFRAMTRVFAEGQCIQYDSVLSMLKGMKNTQEEGKFAIDAVPESFLKDMRLVEGGNLDLLIDLVIKAWIRRDIDSEVADELKRVARDGNRTYKEVLEHMGSLMRAKEMEYESLLGTTPQTMSEGMAQVIGQIGASQDHQVSGWHSGFQRLTDSMGGGGLVRKRVYIFGGRPGDGKSIMLQNLAVSVTNQGGRVFLLSLEMTPDVFWQRILVAEAGLEWDRIHGQGQAQPLSKDELSRLAESTERLSKHKRSGDFRIEYMRDPTLARLRNKVAQEYERGMDLLLVDYASYRKVTPVNDKLPPNMQQSHVSQWLSDTAKEFNIPVVSAAQMSRAIDQRSGPPIMSDLENSIAMEQDADWVGLFQSEDVKGMGLDYTVTNCHVVKSRFGFTCVAPLASRKHLFRFDEMEAGS